MKHRFGLALLLSLLLSVSTQAQQQPAPGDRVDLAQQVPAEIRVQLGKSLLITSQEPLQRVSVTDPTVASSIIISPTQILIHGIKAGSGTLILWDTQERARSFNLTVELDINTLRGTIGQMFPGESLQVMQSGSSLVLTGNVSNKTVSDRAAALAGTYSPAVVNLVTTTEGRQIVLLQVRFAEVDRTAIQQVGMNIFSTGAGNTLGALGTNQFGQPVGNVGAIPSDVEGGGSVGAPNVVSGGIGRTNDRTPGSFGLNDLLNIFIFRPDLNLATAIRALQQKNVLQVLAEPNVMAINGTEASFLAGGEFPFPIVQSAAGAQAVTIQFKEFGVRLNFTPQIMPDGVIRLKVSPEVSALDFANGLNISGFFIPALSSRKATTEVELRDGQSFAIAGLIDNRLTEIASKVPILGDVPIIGNLFRSKSENRAKTELLVMVTPRVISATTAGQLPPLPEFPKSFLDTEKFDGKSGESPSGR